MTSPVGGIRGVPGVAYPEIPASLALLVKAGVYPSKRRADVVNTVTRVMMIARWREVPKSIIFSMLRSDEYRLARQLRGTGKRKYSPKKIDEILEEKWSLSYRLVQESKAKGFDHEVELKRAWVEVDEKGESLTDDEFAIMTALFLLAWWHAEEEGSFNINVAGPAREVAAVTGFSPKKAHAIMRRLCQRGRWLALRSRGLPGPSGVANVYALVPAARRGPLSSLKLSEQGGLRGLPAPQPNGYIDGSPRTTSMYPPEEGPPIAEPRTEADPARTSMYPPQARTSMSPPPARMVRPLRLVPQLSDGVMTEEEHPPWPAHETGPCAKCRQPCHRYGDGARTLCMACWEERYPSRP